MTVPTSPHGGYFLGRRVEHDERSRLFRFTERAEITRRLYVSHLPVFDQGALGSCTGNAAVGLLGYDPYWATTRDEDTFLILDQEFAVSVYSAATLVDEWPGSYPPTDTGSSGLAVAKVLTSMGLISGYTHAFGFLDVLNALMFSPLIVGTNWYDSMFYPTSSGVVFPGGGVAGGHEYIVDGFDPATDMFHCRNSWGLSWGDGGSFLMGAPHLERLLAEDGDATVFVPVTQPAPVPTPEPVPDAPGCRSTFLPLWRRP